MSQPFWPFGTKLYRKNPSTSAWEAVPQVKVASAPGFTQEYDDTTNHDSTGGFRERLKTMKAPKDLSIELVWNPELDMHRTLYADSLANDERDWKLVLPNARVSTWYFRAFVSGFDLPIPTDKAAVVTTTLAVTGVPTGIL